MTVVFLFFFINVRASLSAIKQLNIHFLMLVLYRFLAMGTSGCSDQIRQPYYLRNVTRGDKLETN